MKLLTLRISLESQSEVSGELGIEDAVDAEFFGEFRDGSADGDQLAGLGLELGGLWFSGFVGSHEWVLVSFGPEMCASLCHCPGLLVGLV